LRAPDKRCDPPIAATPLWTDSAAGFGDESSAGPLPNQIDVLVVGAGYTGLAAARETTAAGRSTLVLDGAPIGAPDGSGCSSRNGGQVAYSIKPSFATLSRRHGAVLARRICEEGLRAVANLRNLATLEHLDCDWRPKGGFHGAHTRRHFTAMALAAEHQPAGLERRIRIVARAAQSAEIASDFYHGGVVYEDDASIHPARLLAALLARARASGATVVGRCPVLALAAVAGGPASGGFDVLTPRGRVRARRVLIATNGYSGSLSPWHRRRVIPIGSYQIATERLGPDFVKTLIPEGRNVSDSRRVVVYYRPSPDGERLVFGGRASPGEQNPLACVPRLRRMMTEIFPQLEGVGISHAWVGWVAYTFDTLPHLGQRDGIHYCMGYCGQGVPLAPYFGMRIGQQIADRPEGRTALDGLPFPTRPYYFGMPWFLAPSVFAYRCLDKLGW
jgi:glycine/D-amino acid oxidase-like deaminating enzyme